MIHDPLHKDWVKHIIIICGILIGLWIVVGFIGHARYFLSVDYSNTNDTHCENCITEQDNNYQQTIPISSRVRLELPSSKYSIKDIVVLENPEESFVKIGQVTPYYRKNWALEFEAVDKGYVDIVIKGINETVPDYHTVILIE